MADLASILRARVAVTEIPGWRTRVRPGAFAPVGVVVHHTAGTKSLSIIVGGRPDLPGPLANLHIPKAGAVNLVSAGRANHAGAGAALVLADVRRDVAPTGDAAARGLVDGPVGNGYFYGIEAENLGNGADSWPPAQLETIARACAAICAHHGWSANRVIGHREWTRRKPDPRGFVMASLRARVASLLRPAPPAPPPTTPNPEETDMFIAYVNGGGAWLMYADGTKRLLDGTEIEGLKSVLRVAEAPKLIAATPDAG